jgi:prealbumin domain-containing protein
VYQSTDVVGQFAAAPDGTKPNVTLTSNPSVTLSVTDDNCASPGTVSGQCTVTFTSNSATEVTIHANVTLIVNGVSLTRSTGDSTSQDSEDATKIFIDGVLNWTKVDNAGALLGRAVFTVCQTTSYDSASAQFVDIVDDCFDVSDDTDGTNGPAAAETDQDGTAGEFKLTGLPLGDYAVTEKTAPQGYEKDSTTRNGSLYPGHTSDTVSVAFVNNRPIVKLTAFGYENAASGTPTAGIVSGTTTYKVKNHNYGLAGTTVTVTLVITGPTPAGGTVEVSSTGGASGVLVGDDCAAGCEFTWTFSLAGENGGTTDDSELQATIAYTNIADGSEIQADLTVSYTTNGLARSASGSPASIDFTIQSD